MGASSDRLYTPKIPPPGAGINDLAVSVTGTARNGNISISPGSRPAIAGLFTLGNVGAGGATLGIDAGRQARLEAGATQERRLQAIACTPVLGVSRLLLLSLSLIAKHMARSEPRTALEQCAGCACAVAPSYCVTGNPALIAETLSTPAILQIG